MSMGFPDGEYNSRLAYEKALRKWWLPLALMLCGALAGFLLYTGYRSLAGQETFEQVSKLYIDFAKDGTGKEADYFNGATWTDLLTAHPDLYGEIEKELLATGLTEEDVPEETFAGYIKNHVRAEILSDVRLLTITVRGQYRDVLQNTTDAVNDALVSFGDSAKEFESITFLSADAPRLVRPDDRTRNAVLLGAFLGLLDGILVLWLLSVTDDSLCVPEEAERRYGLPVLATVCRDNGNETARALEAEGRANLARFLAEAEEPAAVITPEGKEAAQALVQKLGEAAGKLSAKEATDYEALRQARRVILALPAGKRNGAAAEHIISELGKQGCPVSALVLSDADGAFLNRYYHGHLPAGENGGNG